MWCRAQMRDHRRGLLAVDGVRAAATARRLRADRMAACLRRGATRWVRDSISAVAEIIGSLRGRHVAMAILCHVENERDVALSIIEISVLSLRVIGGACRPGWECVDD